jgi:hypothetical protein
MTSDYPTKDELESALREHFEAIEAEMARRDEWLIDAIWSAINASRSLINQGIAIVVCLVMGWTAWWQILLALALAFLANIFDHGRIERLRADDKKRIKRDSALGKFYIWPRW